MIVRKFGGSSLADSERIKNVAHIIQDRQDQVVVLSAMKGITNLLIEVSGLAELGDQSYHEKLENIKNITIKTAHDLSVSQEKIQEINQLLVELKDILHGIELVKECSPRSLDLVSSFGERFSCRLMTGYLLSLGIDATYIDARKLIVTNTSFNHAAVDSKATKTKILSQLRNIDKISIMTGFIGATNEGITTTLGRNGSDYSASIVGGALDAEKVEIWTDVDGVLSADPRFVQNAFVINELSTQEAMELSYFGAEVIHPSTMLPVVEKNIPIVIKNTLNPSAAGTKIIANPKRHSNPITGIASIEKVCMINVEGGGMIGMPGAASKVFTALAEADINIVMISQASSEHSICLVCKANEANLAMETLQTKLQPELQSKLIQSFDLQKELEIIAIIGENMRGTPGISGKLFKALGDAGINVLAIAQGSSERNISFVIHKSSRNLALNVVHDAFLGPKGS
ncbi:aspartate kinase [Spirochaeta cellobiosiphila]|uniref:aspartate kinase n=1 Tax=Spirochaeta cellobiosiphila TaxID=504483 RepID=UPI000405DFDB|nr:aspartate kinase [Spirochaeta cellobiosiphila]